MYNELPWYPLLWRNVMLISSLDGLIIPLGMVKYPLAILLPWGKMIGVVGVLKMLKPSIEIEDVLNLKKLYDKKTNYQVVAQCNHAKPRGILQNDW